MRHEVPMIVFENKLGYTGPKLPTRHAQSVGLCMHGSEMLIAVAAEPSCKSFQTGLHFSVFLVHICSISA